MKDKQSAPQLGSCLKAARRTRGLTLTDVSGLTGMALSTLSKVENHQMSLTYDKLLQLSNGMGMQIAELFQAPNTTPVFTARRTINRSGQGQLIRTRHYNYIYECVELLRKRMVPISIEVLSRTLEEFGPLIRHPGEEYFLVLEGEITFHTEFYGADTLHVGDSIYIDASMGHAYLNCGEGVARGLCVCSGDSPDMFAQLREIAQGDATEAVAEPASSGVRSPPKRKRAQKAL